MPYCDSCGKEIDEGDRFCPHCGAPIGRVIEYRRPRERVWTAGRIIVVVIGAIILLASIGILVAGSVIMIANRNLSDDEGFLLIGPADLQAYSYAIVGKGVNIEFDPASQVWIERAGDFITLKLVASNNDPSKEVFIGIAQEADASGYFQDMLYHEVGEFHWSYGPWDKPQIDFTMHPGMPPVAPPTVYSWWTAISSGPGTQELEWVPESGRYWIVVMNADGSAEVDVSISIGARVPLLITIGNALVVGGVIALVIAVALLYTGIIRRS